MVEFQSARTKDAILSSSSYSNGENDEFLWKNNFTASVREIMKRKNPIFFALINLRVIYKRGIGESKGCLDTTLFVRKW